MSDTQTVEAPIMLRARITRDELKELRKLALDENKDTQDLLGELIRARLARAAA